MSALALAGAALVGCGRFAFEAREPWRAQAEEACLRAKVVQPSAYLSRLAEIDGPGSCGMTYPFRASAFAAGEVALTTGVTLSCPIIPEIDSWLLGTVQPAADLYFGEPVIGLRAGSYSCRSRNNQSGARMSEHSYGNALDVFAFRLAGGREITLRKGWRGADDEQEFLREVFLGACRHFTTVLAPGSDAFHDDHLHLDLARHDARGLRRVCKPLLKFEPRLDPDRVSRGPESPRPRGTERPARLVDGQAGAPRQLRPSADLSSGLY
ncbi:extensin family protein [Enterovirga sp.]|uniref:extensin-like domain-containing protein n=1 Tax=Enterovirga sp. TaxID=2026350 RepID=UPI002629881D|nr:extensin family protein [Enterovirga sp.]